MERNDRREIYITRGEIEGKVVIPDVGTFVLRMSGDDAGKRGEAFYEDGERVWDITGSEYEGMWEFSSATVKKHSYDRDPYVALARMIIKSME